VLTCKRQTCQRFNVQTCERSNVPEKYGREVRVDLKEARKRAEELIKFGFGIADAAHVAFAEMVGAEFISCDKKLVRKCKRYKIRVWCSNPVAFCIKEDLK